MSRGEGATAGIVDANGGGETMVCIVPDSARMLANSVGTFGSSFTIVAANGAGETVVVDASAGSAGAFRKSEGTCTGAERESGRNGAGVTLVFIASIGGGYATFVGSMGTRTKGGASVSSDAIALAPTNEAEDPGTSVIPSSGSNAANGCEAGPAGTFVGDGVNGVTALFVLID